MSHIQRTHPSTTTAGPQGGVGGYHDQTMTGGVCDAEAYIYIDFCCCFQGATRRFRGFRVAFGHETVRSDDPALNPPSLVDRVSAIQVARAMEELIRKAAEDPISLSCLYTNIPINNTIL